MAANHMRAGVAITDTMRRVLLSATPCAPKDR